jgi:hypothetical protein
MGCQQVSVLIDRLVAPRHLLCRQHIAQNGKAEQIEEVFLLVSQAHDPTSPQLIAT